MNNKYQAIPDKFLIYQENDFQLPCDNNINNQEENLSKLLIILCPTNCNGGEINFPLMKKKFTPESTTNETLCYILFGINTQYEIKKIIKNLRCLLVYKIFESPFNIELINLTVSDTRRLKNILKNITETNVLIPITKGNNIKKICDNIKVKYQQVYSAKECPKIVYSELDRNEMEFYYKGWEECDVDFYSLIKNSKRFTVGLYINFSKPEVINDIVVRYRKYGTGPEESNYEVDYYSFILINPCENKISESDSSSPDPSESDPSEEDPVEDLENYQ